MTTSFLSVTAFALVCLLYVTYRCARFFALDYIFNVMRKAYEHEAGIKAVLAHTQQEHAEITNSSRREAALYAHELIKKIQGTIASSFCGYKPSILSIKTAAVVLPGKKWQEDLKEAILSAARISELQSYHEDPV